MKRSTAFMYPRTVKMRYEGGGDAKTLEGVRWKRKFRAIHISNNTRKGDWHYTTSNTTNTTSNHYHHHHHTFQTPKTRETQQNTQYRATGGQETVTLPKANISCVILFCAKKSKVACERAVLQRCSREKRKRKRRRARGGGGMFSLLQQAPDGDECGRLNGPRGYFGSCWGRDCTFDSCLLWFRGSYHALSLWSLLSVIQSKLFLFLLSFLRFFRFSLDSIPCMYAKKKKGRLCL